MILTPEGVSNQHKQSPLQLYSRREYTMSYDWSTFRDFICLPIVPRSCSSLAKQDNHVWKFHLIQEQIVSVRDLHKPRHLVDRLCHCQPPLIVSSLFLPNKIISVLHYTISCSTGNCKTFVFLSQSKLLPHRSVYGIPNYGFYQCWNHCKDKKSVLISIKPNKDML